MNRTKEPTSRHRFYALQEALDMNAALRVVHDDIRQHDADLARQIRRAARSVALNLGEGRRRRGKDRTYHYRVAAGSAEETQVAIQLALAWCETSEEHAAPCLKHLDNVLAILWRITERG